MRIAPRRRGRHHAPAKESHRKHRCGDRRPGSRWVGVEPSRPGRLAGPRREISPATRSSVNARSRADCSRSSGSLRRHCRTTLLQCGRRHRLELRHRAWLAGHDRRDQARLALPRERPSPRSPSRRARSPAPTDRCAHPASLPSSCSGAMYWNVPTIVPSAVSGRRHASATGSPIPATGTSPADAGEAEVQELGARAGEHDVCRASGRGAPRRRGARDPARRRSAGRG